MSKLKNNKNNKLLDVSIIKAHPEGRKRTTLPPHRYQD